MSYRIEIVLEQYSLEDIEYLNNFLRSLPKDARLVEYSVTEL